MILRLSLAGSDLLIIPFIPHILLKARFQDADYQFFLFLEVLPLH
jgi:hypothetical protein